MASMAGACAEQWSNDQSAASAAQKATPLKPRTTPRAALAENSRPALPEPRFKTTPLVTSTSVTLSTRVPGAASTETPVGVWMATPLTIKVSATMRSGSVVHGAASSQRVSMRNPEPSESRTMLPYKRAPLTGYGAGSVYDEPIERPTTLKPVPTTSATLFSSTHDDDSST